jgi:iron complex transport system ATP-binding protein
MDGLVSHSTDNTDPGHRTPSHMPMAVEMHGVTAGYHQQPVLRDVTFSIESGEFIGVLGPNGAGKTTMLRCLTGLCSPMSGFVSLFGTPLQELPPVDRARLMAVVPQSFETPMPFSVKEIVMIGRTASLGRWARPTREDWHIVDEAMAFTDLSDLKNRPFTELSGGERQRAIVAMALAQRPRMILLDEATSNLDINHRLEVMQIVERLNREAGMTVLMISHDLNLASEFCSRLLLLDHGRLVGDGPPASVLTQAALGRVYHCDVHVEQNSMTGAVNVFPATRLLAHAPGQGIRIHVVAGGGTGQDVMRRLCLCRFAVTAGVLNSGDSDQETAAALGIRTVTEKPFSAIGAAAIEEARRMVDAASAVVVCGVPFGPGNIANLQLASEALAAGKPVFLMDGVPDRDYTLDRAATRTAAALTASGAVMWRDLTELPGLLVSSTPRSAEFSS